MKKHSCALLRKNHHHRYGVCSSSSQQQQQLLKFNVKRNLGSRISSSFTLRSFSTSFKTTFPSDSSLLQSNHHGTTTTNANTTTNTLNTTNTTTNTTTTTLNTTNTTTEHVVESFPKLIQTISYPIPSHSILCNSSQRVHCVFEKTFHLSHLSIPLSLEINTRNLNIEFCEHEEDSLRVEMYTHNCNEYSWYNLNNTPQGFFSDYKFEYLCRELTNTLRFNVHQAPLPPLLTRFKLHTYYAPVFFLPSFISKYLDEKFIKYGTMKIYLPKKSKNSIRVETDIGNVIFRGISNISNEVSVKSTFGTLYVSDGGISNVNHFHIDMQYGACYINTVNHVKNLNIYHRWSREEDWNTSDNIVSSTGITIDHIESNSHVKIQTLNSINIELNQLNLAGNCQVEISCLMKGQEWMFTKKGIQVFVSNNSTTTTTTSSHHDDSQPSHTSSTVANNQSNKLKIYSDANPVFLYFDKNSSSNYDVLALTRWSDVSFDSQHILYDGFLDVNQFRGIVVSRNDLKRLRELSEQTMEQNSTTNTITTTNTTTTTDSLTEATSSAESNTPTTTTGSSKSFSTNVHSSDGECTHPISGHISLITKQGPIFMKQYEYVNSAEEFSNTFIEKRLIIQKQQVAKYFVHIFGMEIAKKDLFVYGLIPIAIFMLLVVDFFYVIPTFGRQSELKESGGLASMGNTGTIRVAQRETTKEK
nr:unnamed protein product [Naegleria fowleri]